jgi:FkbH-like protein
VKSKPILAIAGTFTAEPVEEPLSFWLNELDLEHEIRFAPYGQVLQSILDPRGSLRSNTGGVNVVLLRTRDWATAGESAVDQLGDAIAGAASSADWIVAVCPSANAERSIEGALRRLRERVPFVHFAMPEDILDLYPVHGIYDETADQLGHVPYTAEFFTALATWIARRIQALRMPPYKVLALDCDNTLWDGICGEDGPAGVAIPPARRFLHDFALEQRAAGMLLCLCSKNNEADVLETFRGRGDSPLQPEHFAAWRINWGTKSSNLAELAAELNLGLDSFVFVDDDRRECAEVSSDCPAVLTLPLPEDPEDIAPFFRHIWAFDRPRITEADRARAAQYQQSAERKRAQRQAGTVAAFIAGLDLRVRIDVPQDEELARVAQLTQRTNQMNFSTVRRSEPELRVFLAGENHQCRCVHVSDRFGDYGLVGAMLFSTVGSSLVLDTFVLSCRSLGRGVEHRMLAYLGAYAVDQGLETLEIRFAETAKNAPARELLESVNALRAEPIRLPAREAAGIAWRPPEAAPGVEVSQPPAARQTSARRFDDYTRIALELRTVDQILARIKESKRNGAGTRTARGGAPQNEIERGLASIWSDLLGIDGVGRDENFFDLGGHSLLAVRLLSRIRQQFGVDLSLDVVYGGPLTVAELARAIELGELGAISPAEYEALLLEIEAMPEEDVRAYLEAEEDRERG